MVELVFVILIVGVLAAAIAPRFMESPAVAERGFFEELVSAARYAQKRAVAANCPVQLRITTNGYTLNQPDSFCAANFNDPVLDPSGGAFTGTAPSGVTISGQGGTSLPLTVVYTAAGGTTLGTSNDATLAVGSHSFLIHATTGYAESL